MTLSNQNSDILESLIQAEKKYLDTLDIIDSKLSPLWMIQLDTAAPDFSELLKCIRDIIIVNKSFFEKLTNISSQNDLGDLLMHLTSDMKKPYYCYSENLINNINQRQDIVCTPSIQKLLHDINSQDQQQQEKETVTLETLLYAPLYQLNTYKSLFNKDNLCIDQQYLDEANQLFDTLMIKNSLPPVKLDSFHTQVDCSSVADILTDKQVPNYQLQPLSKVLLCDTFHCNELSKRVRLILTVNNLIFCSMQEGSSDNKDLKYALLFTPVPIKDISIRIIHADRELIGEYNAQLWIQNQRLFTMKSSSKEGRNMWLGIDISSSTRDQSLRSWVALNDIVSKYDIRRQSSTKVTSTPKPIRTQDIFSFYNDQNGEISPLVSSSDESEENDEDSNSTWEEEEEGEKKTSPKIESVSASDKLVDRETNIGASSSASDTNSMLEQKSLPPPPPVPEKNLKVPTLPLEPSKNNGAPSPPPHIVSGTQSLPSRNASLKQLPIPSNIFVPVASAPNADSSPLLNRPPNVRSMSAHQSVNGRPVSLHQQQLHQQPPMPSNSPYLQQTQQQNQQLPDIPAESSSKKNSFMRSVMNAVSSPRSSFLLRKSTSKPNLNNAFEDFDSSSSSSAASSVKESTNKSGTAPNMSAVSLDQQTPRSKDHNASLRRYSAANMAEQQQQQAPATPQHLAIPPPQSPFAQRPSSVINNQSTPSFISSMSTSSQASLALTPPLSRPSSPGSVTPNSLNRYTTPSSSSSEDLGSPPGSPDIITQANTIKSVLYSNDKVRVFRWKEENESWYAVEEDCLLEVRQTYANRSCVAIHMKNTGQLYLNAWILPDTFIVRTSETDLSLSLHITNDQSALENYLFHCESKLEADRLNGILEQMHQESIKMNMVISATSTLRGVPPVMMGTSSPMTATIQPSPSPQDDVAKGFKLAMQCKCKLYSQSSTAKWNSFGSVYLKVSQQYATKKMHVAMESHKGGKTTQLVSAMVQSRNVERLGQKRITFLLVDEVGRNSVVYMVQVREELTGDKIYEYVKTKNAENGW